MPASPSDTARSIPPRAAVFIRTDTLGDLVLFSPALRSLRSAWPQTRIVVVIQRSYLDLAALLVPGVEWIGTAIDPARQGPGEADGELKRLRAVIVEVAPDLVVGACSSRCWLDAALASAMPQARRVAFGSIADDPFHGVQLRQRLGVTNADAYTETAPLPAHALDWERNYGLIEHLLGRRVEHVPPALALDAGWLRAADEALRRLGLESGKFVACAAAGFANVGIKTWPAARFSASIASLHARQGLRTLLVGHDGERAWLESVREAAGSAAPAVWTGGEGGLPFLAALLARSALYFGNDTGAMHLAAALGRPVVAIFGGGTWPRFQPAARQAIALVNPLPCFGCGWDCPFGDAPCVQAVGVPEAGRALADALRRGAAPFSEVRESNALPEAAKAIMGNAAAIARERAAAHLARQRKVEELIAVCEERLQVINRLDQGLKLMYEDRARREAGQK